jgi:D-aspartate ligase
MKIENVNIRTINATTATTAMTTAPAVIVGGGLNALGIVRSLGRCGIPLLVVDTDAKSPAMRSRYGRKCVVEALEGEQLIESLLQLAQHFSSPVMLFLTEEKSVNTVSAQRDRLAGAFILRLPPHLRLMQLMHKQGFSELADIYQAPVPKTVRIENTDDLAKLATLKFPCVFKPGSKSYAYGARFKKAYKVASAAEVAALFTQIAPVLADMVVQEWIEGDDADIYFCLQYIGEDGVAASSFTGRKIRSWPPRIGGTASCTAAWEHQQELAETTSRFFRDVGFTGMGSMEYKRDVRDNKFYMIEPTVARTDFQEEVATLNGVNIPLAAYCHELGLPFFSGEAFSPLALPRIWRDPQADRWSFEEDGCKPDQRSASHKIFDAYFRWNDPLPWIYFMLERLLSRLGRSH